MILTNFSQTLLVSFTYKCLSLKSRAGYMELCGWPGAVYASHAGVSLSLIGCFQPPANEEGTLGINLPGLTFQKL